MNDLANTFNAQRAEGDAESYLKKGLSKRGRSLLAYLFNHLQSPATVLDIGCGAGGAHHELLRRGVVSQVIGVDASPAYLQAAQANAERLGVGAAVTYHQADFAQAAQQFEAADVVLLDRVICCYPYLRELLAPAAARARHYLALSFPVEAGWLRLPFRLLDGLLTLFGSKYHPYLHRRAEVIAIAEAAGLQSVHTDRSGFWQIMVFARGHGLAGLTD
ncbi:MAG: class I SAM-dependent methyltransferase [Chloroflexota bacterium]